MVLRRAGAAISTLDLFTRNFCVLAAPDGSAWCAAARAAAADLGLPLDAHHLDRGDVGDPDGQLAAAYGLSPSGAVIVRPDGFVAWRAVDDKGATRETMAAALSSLMGRGGAVLP
jgi:putative polyketide hydroxylase